MDIFEIFFDTPAWLIGQIIGAIISFMLVTGAVLAGVYAGRSVYLTVRIPFVRMVAALVIGLYVAVVLFRSQTWAAVAILDYTHRDDD